MGSCARVRICSLIVGPKININVAVFNTHPWSCDLLSMHSIDREKKAYL